MKYFITLSPPNESELSGSYFGFDNYKRRLDAMMGTGLMHPFLGFTQAL